VSLREEVNKMRKIIKGVQKFLKHKAKNVSYIFKIYSYPVV